MTVLCNIYILLPHEHLYYIKNECFLLNHAGKYRDCHERIDVEIGGMERKSSSLGTSIGYTLLSRFRNLRHPPNSTQQLVVMIVIPNTNATSIKTSPTRHTRVSRRYPYLGHGSYTVVDSVSVVGVVVVEVVVIVVVVGGSVVSSSETFRI